MRFTRSSRPRVRSFDLTPMIDVTFQLILFFLFTSRLSEQSRTPIDLPRERGDAASLPGPADLVVDVDQAGAMLVDGAAVSDEQLRSLAQAVIAIRGGDAAAVSVRFRADRATPAATINRAVRMLAGLGIRRCTLATAQPPTGGSR